MALEVPLSFTLREYAARLEKVRAAMAGRSVDVLVIVDPSNMAWLTGYDGWSFYTAQAVVLAGDSDPVWWGRAMDANGARRTIWMGDASVVSFDDEYVMNPDRHPARHLAALLGDLGHATARIGVEMDNYYYSAAAHRHLVDSLPEAVFVDTTALVNWQRTVKSDQELVYMRRAAEIIEGTHLRLLELIEPGMRKNDLVAEAFHSLITGTDEFGGDYPAIVPMMPTGADASAAHLTWDDRPFEVGKVTFLELAGCHRRYHVPLCRSIHLGPPPREIVEAERALVEGLDNGLAVARAGNRACDVANTLQTTLARAGIERNHRCGYPIGLSYPPDWGERTISFRASDETVFEPGMTFHFMPGLWMDDWGLEITESFVITDEGPAETFCQLPRELFVKD